MCLCEFAWFSLAASEAADFLQRLNVVGLQTPFQRLAHQMQDVLGDGGILKEVLHEGEGALVPRDASVSSEYQTQGRWSLTNTNRAIGKLAVSPWTCWNWSLSTRMFPFIVNVSYTRSTSVLCSYIAQTCNGFIPEYSAPSASRWNNLQITLKLEKLVSQKSRSAETDLQIYLGCNLSYCPSFVLFVRFMLFLWTVHFSAFLEYSDQPFESTRSFRFPKMMKLGKGKCFLEHIPFLLYHSTFPAMETFVLVFRIVARLRENSVSPNTCVAAAVKRFYPSLLL